MKGLFATLKSIAYVVNLVFIYYYHGHYSNEYQGYGQIVIDFEYFILFLTAILFTSFLMGREYKKPSDFFLLLYGLIVIVPYSVFPDIWGRGNGTVVFNLILVAAPFFCVLFICGMELKLPKFSIARESLIEKIILLVSVLTVVMLLLNRPESASFSFADSYTRRIEARDVYGTGSVQSYLSAMVMNGVLPVLVFIGVFWRRMIFLLIGFFLYLGFFYIYGVKAPVIYMIFSGLFAHSLRRGGDGRHFYVSIGYIFLGCFALVWLELLIFGYSYVEDYLIRRLFYVGSYLIGAYFELINSNIFSWSHGLVVPTLKSISVYVGEDFLGLPDTNANTNTFLYFLAQYGLFGYVFVMFFVGCFLSFLNSIRFKNKIFILISIMYSILILEQSATTALVSSGIGLLVIAFYMSKTRESGNCE